MKAQHKKGLMKSFVSGLMGSKHIDLKSLSQSSSNQITNLKRALKENNLSSDRVSTKITKDYEVSVPGLTIVPKFEDYLEKALHPPTKNKPFDAIIASCDRKQCRLYTGKFIKAKNGPPVEEILFETTLLLELGEKMAKESWVAKKTKIPVGDIIIGLSLSTTYKKNRNSIFPDLNNYWTISINSKYFEGSSQQTTSTNPDEISQGSSLSQLLKETRDTGTSVSRTMSICDETKIEFLIDINNDGQMFYVDWSYLDEDKVLPLDFSFDKEETDDGHITLVPNLSENPVLVMKKRESIKDILKKDQLAKCCGGGNSSDGSDGSDGSSRKRNIGFKPIIEPNTAYWCCELADELVEKIYDQSKFDEKFLEKLSAAAKSSAAAQLSTTGQPPNNRDDNEHGPEGSNPSETNIEIPQETNIELPQEFQHDTPIIFSDLLRQILGFREIFEVKMDKNRPIEAYFSGEIIFN